MGLFTPIKIHVVGTAVPSSSGRDKRVSLAAMGEDGMTKLSELLPRPAILESSETNLFVSIQE